MSVTERPQRPSPARRAFYAVPVIGWIARDLAEGGSDNIYYLLVAVLSLWAIAVMTWGLPALTLTAVALVPAIMATLVLLTIGR
ncbi:hypothetical protein DRV84_01795 [Rhodosalinus sediminis]|uniref:Uncharacterized protein n=1 Tax=Rhodosalinus sediminis TaxID=1940533 RepID=A0A3D9C064_9RHOB|nr:hypothetical protein [Rhodosalinus sediminis]REC58976.1 hypothetical protein DRV84_01795 [Rhodosalinus sediminis]